jgi:predicted PurR-regulated permease PerM
VWDSISCFMMAVPFLSPIAWSVALAVVCVPLQRRIEALVRSPGLAAGISVFLIGAVSLIFVIFVGQRLAQEASSGTQVINTRIESGEWRRAIEQHPRLIPVADWVEQQNLPATVKSTVTWMSTTGAGFVRGSVIELVSVLLTFYLLFYLLRDRRAAISALRTSLPLSSAEMDRMLHRVGDTLHATIYGTLVVASVQGFLGGLMFWFLGLSAPLLWGVVMGLLAIIPILGAFVVWIPATLFLAAEGRWWQALILALWGVIVVGTIDNLLRPILVGRRLQLPTVLAFISVVGGIAVFGSSGLILGPVALTVTMVLLEIWPHRILVKDLPSTDSNAIDRFVNEGGPPAAIFDSSKDN